VWAKSVNTELVLNMGTTVTSTYGHSCEAYLRNMKQQFWINVALYKLHRTMSLFIITTVDLQMTLSLNNTQK